MTLLRVAVAGGFLAGALDITYAIIANGLRGIPAVTIFQSIASGLLGRAAYSGGTATAALGLALHFAMAFVMAAGFAIAARAVPILLRKPLVAGVLYGVLLFAVMNFVVVPYSAAYPGKFPSGWMLAGALFAHTALVGVPIALMAKRTLR